MPFEYRVIGLIGNDPLGSELSDKLTALGAQNWRLVAIEGRYIFMERETAVDAEPATQEPPARPQLLRR